MAAALGQMRESMLVSSTCTVESGSVREKSGNIKQQLVGNHQKGCALPYIFTPHAPFATEHHRFLRFGEVQPAEGFGLLYQHRRG